MPRVNYTAAEYTDMILIYGECHQNAALTIQTYRERYGNKRVCPSNSRTIVRAIQRLRDNEPLVPRQEGIAPQQMPVAREKQVLNYFEQNPTSSLRRAARQFRICHGTVRNILERNDKRRPNNNCAKKNRATVAHKTQLTEDIKVQTNEVSEQKVKSSTVTEPPRVPGVEPYQPSDIPEVRALNLRVYRNLREEYEQLKELTGNRSDLTPLADILKRTAAVTGFSEHTVTDILEHDAMDAEYSDDDQKLDLTFSEDISQVKEELDDVSSEEEQDLKLKIEVETNDESSHLLVDDSLVTIKIEPGKPEPPSL